MDNLLDELADIIDKLEYDIHTNLSTDEAKRLAKVMQSELRTLIRENREFD